MDAEEAYRVLGVAPGSSPKQVQAEYRKKVLEFHPDRAATPEQADYFHRRFLEVRDAYEHLRREGFPVPETREVVPEVSEEGWTAGRSFAPKPGQAEEVGLAQKLGFDFSVDLGAALLWLVLIPAGAVGTVYFVRFLLRTLRGG